MSYQPLARKYRPAKFSDLVGQDSVAKALAGAITLDRLHPSIIFSGVRGIGKTTTARLLAKALCCDKGVSPEPCGECESCLAVSRGNHEDVLEIDGASNNGVDEVRSLRETVLYIPQRSKYKIYIIDEVHMLSVSAFNALLKTLEEPPPNVVFIFATTELHKVPATVLGRCLTFHLKKFTDADIINRIKHILTLENIAFDEKALTFIAKEGHGSMRDALTFLDQVIAVGDGIITLEAVQSLVTSISSIPFLNLLEALIKKDAAQIFDIIEHLDSNGAVFFDIATGLASFARHAFVLHGLGSHALEKSLLGLSQDELKRLQEIISFGKTLDFNRIFRMIHACQKELDGSDLDKFTFENCLLEWCLDPGLPNIENLLSGDYFTSDKKSNSAATNTLIENATASQPQQDSAASKFKPKQSLVKTLMSELKKTNDQSIQQPTKLAVPLEKDEISTAKEITFPESWRKMVDEWRRLKPIQALKLEEVHPLVYNKQEITVAVEPHGMIGKELLSPTFQAQLTQTFKELFDFNGSFRVVAKAEAESMIHYHEEKAPQQHHTLDISHNKIEKQILPNSIEQEKKIESDERREKILTSAKDHPLTQSILKEFNGEVIDIKINEKTKTSIHN